MSDAPHDSEEFYVGYLGKAPADTARFIRRRVTLLLLTTALGAAAAAASLPFLGRGVFEFGRHRDLTGVVQCTAGHAVLATDAADIPLVGFGKHGAPIELCGDAGRTATISGTRIARDGRELHEIAALTLGETRPVPGPEPVELGHVEIVGEIVDAKCFFGVMNPGEARAHRACAQQCVRGGIPAVFFARDTTGATAHLIIDRAGPVDFTRRILPVIGEPVRVAGEVSRQGRWLVIRVTEIGLAP